VPDKAVKTCLDKLMVGLDRYVHSEEPTEREDSHPPDNQACDYENQGQRADNARGDMEAGGGYPLSRDGAADSDHNCDPEHTH
jgi:hypothetical protein